MPTNLQLIDKTPRFGDPEVQPGLNALLKKSQQPLRHQQRQRRSRPVTQQL